MTVRFLRPTSDLVFKKIFGENPDIVRSFLNSILPLPKDGLIESIEYLPSEQIPRIPILKNTIVDVKCKDKNKRVFIVEMQMAWSASFMKRFLFNASKAYAGQLDVGEYYQNLCPVYGLAILNDTFGLDKSDRWYYRYRVADVDNPQNVIEGLELVLVELPQFKPRDWSEKKLGALWLRFLREMKEGLDEVPQEFLEDTCMAKAVKLTQEASYTKAQLESYDAFLDAVRVQNTYMRDSLNEGRAIGKEEGMKEGKEETKIDIAKQMLCDGMSLEVVQKYTGLTHNEIAELKSIA